MVNFKEGDRVELLIVYPWSARTDRWVVGTVEKVGSLVFGPDCLHARWYDPEEKRELPGIFVPGEYREVKG